MTCISCGLQLQPAEKFCGGCGVGRPADTAAFVPPPSHPEPSPVLVAAPQRSTAFVPTPAPEQSAPFGTMPPLPPLPPVAPPRTGLEDLRLAHGEVIKGVFLLTRIQRPMGWLEGRVVVTDARVMYRAEAKNLFNRSKLGQEIALQDVNGMAVSTNRGLTSVGALTVCAIALLGLVSLVVNPFIFIACLVALGLAFLLMRTTELRFEVNARQSQASPIVLSSGVKEASGNPIAATLRVVMSPMVKLLAVLGIMDAESAVTNSDFDHLTSLYAEIGALILDLQNRGVLADELT